MKIKLPPKIRGFLGSPFVKGLVKEGLSYVPIIGEKLSNSYENKIGTGLTKVDSKTDRAKSDIGRWIVALVVIGLLAKGILTEEQITFLWNLIGI